jgi:hypothetical protein
VALLPPCNRRVTKQAAEDWNQEPVLTTTEEPRPDEAVHATAPGHQRVHVRRERQDSSETITGNSDWTSYEITAQVPADAETIGFELTLAGPGIVRLRHLELARTS